MGPGMILKCASCSEQEDPSEEALRVLQLLHPVCSIWSIVREQLVAGELPLPSFQSSNRIRRYGAIVAGFIGPFRINSARTPLGWTWLGRMDVARSLFSVARRRLPPLS